VKNEQISSRNTSSMGQHSLLPYHHPFCCLQSLINYAWIFEP